jgi:predicted small secreted protein
MDKADIISVGIALVIGVVVYKIVNKDKETSNFSSACGACGG